MRSTMDPSKKTACVKMPGVSSLCLPAATSKPPFQLRASFPGRSSQPQRGCRSHQTLYVVSKQEEIAHYSTYTRRTKSALLSLPCSPLIMFSFLMVTELCNYQWL